MTRVLAAALLSLVLVACGVKHDLDPPQGAIDDKQQVDHSRPPQPLGQ